MRNRPNDKGRAEGDQIELRLFLIDKLPGGALGKSLAGPVGVGLINVLAELLELFWGVGVPVLFGKGVDGLDAGIEDWTGLLASLPACGRVAPTSGVRGRDDYTLDFVTVLLCAFQDTEGSVDGGVD